MKDRDKGEEKERKKRRGRESFGNINSRSIQTCDDLRSEGDAKESKTSTTFFTSSTSGHLDNGLREAAVLRRSRAPRRDPRDPDRDGRLPLRQQRLRHRLLPRGARRVPLQLGGSFRDPFCSRSRGAGVACPIHLCSK